MLSIILPETDDEKVLDYTEDFLYEQIEQMEAEIVRAPSVKEGLKECVGEYICYVEPDCLLSDLYFLINLNLFVGNPLYRKLAIVGSGIGNRSWKDVIYGYKLSGNIVKPKKRVTTRPAHPAQIVYLPGAIIRKSVMVELKIDEANPLESSIETCLKLWSLGNRVMINPNTTYVSNTEGLDQETDFKASKELKEMFKREMI